MAFQQNPTQNKFPPHEGNASSYKDRILVDIAFVIIQWFWLNRGQFLATKTCKVFWGTQQRRHQLVALCFCENFFVLLFVLNNVKLIQFYVWMIQSGDPSDLASNMIFAIQILSFSCICFCSVLSHVLLQLIRLFAREVALLTSKRLLTRVW